MNYLADFDMNVFCFSIMTEHELVIILRISEYSVQSELWRRTKTVSEKEAIYKVHKK